MKLLQASSVMGRRSCRDTVSTTKRFVGTAQQSTVSAGTAQTCDAFETPQFDVLVGKASLSASNRKRVALSQQAEKREHMFGPFLFVVFNDFARAIFWEKRTEK